MCAFRSTRVLLASFASLSSALNGPRLTSSAYASLRIAASLSLLDLQFVEMLSTLFPIPTYGGRHLLPFHTFQSYVRLHCLPASLPKVIHGVNLHETFQKRTMELGKHLRGPMVLVQICAPSMSVTGLRNKKASHELKSFADFETTSQRPTCSIKKSST